MGPELLTRRGKLGTDIGTHRSAAFALGTIPTLPTRTLADGGHARIRDAAESVTGIGSDTKLAGLTGLVANRRRRITGNARSARSRNVVVRAGGTSVGLRIVAQPLGRRASLSDARRGKRLPRYGRTRSDHLHELIARRTGYRPA